MEQKPMLRGITNKDNGLTIYYKKMISKKLLSMDRKLTDFENTAMYNAIKAVEGMQCLDFSTGEELMAFLTIMRDLFSKDVIEGTKLNLYRVSNEGYIDDNFRYKKSDKDGELIDTNCYDIVVKDILFTSNRKFKDEEYSILKDKVTFEAKILPKIRSYVRDEDGVIKMSESYSDSTIFYIDGRDEICIKGFLTVRIPVEVVLIVDDDGNVYLISTKVLQEFINSSDRKPKYYYDDTTKLAHKDYNLRELYRRGERVSIFNFVD